MRRILRLAVLLALAGGLSACFTSKTLLIAPDAAVFPHERIDFRVVDGDGTIQTLERAGDAYRYRPEPDGDSASVRLMAAGADTFVVQFWTGLDSEEKDKQVLYALLVADPAGKRVASYAAVKPDAFTPPPGFVSCGQDVCIEDLEAYVAYARGLVAAGAPPDQVYEIVSTR